MNTVRRQLCANMEESGNRLVGPLRGLVMEVGFGLLGHIEVRVDGRVVDVGHARQQCVLAVLLAEANRVVSVGQLAERVWGDRAPATARGTLQNYLSRLRHVLGSVAGVELGRRSAGYVLTTDPMTVDVHRFRHLIGQARATADQNQAVALFAEALGLWRGEPFAGLDTAWVNAQRDGLERDRFAAELDYTDLQLARGRHGRLLGELTARAAAQPLDERVAGQMMLALYQSGRQADALEHYHQLRDRLAEELGIDPGPGLHRLYEQILTTDPALSAPTTRKPAPASAHPPDVAQLAVPRQLPAHTPHFVGRAAELDQLSTLLDTPAAGGGTVVISAIGGTAGIGKTALALHWAHQAADRFPDGQLYVNLRGFDPTNTPLHPADALRGFLDALGIPPERIPASVETQAGLYRSLLADRRMLVVLDNARDTDQIQPLLPASPDCLVVITSRNQLASLIAQHGARPLTLDLLTPQEARALLTHRLGPDRINTDLHAVTDLINHCARLPLALAIVAARAATHPGFELRVLAKELADEHTRLDALDTGEPTTNIQAVFSWSYQRLSPPAARMFRLLGLHPGPDIALPAATYLADLPPNQARNALSELTRAHLLTQHTPGRYTLHDLLRGYATHLTTTHDPQDQQHAALTRLFDHYLATAAAAMNTVHPTDPQPPTPSPPAMGRATAQHWLDGERANLTALIAHTATHGWHAQTRAANTVLLRYLEIGVQFVDAVSMYTQVRHAAVHHSDNRATEALALTNIGVVDSQHGRYQQAVDRYQQAIAICREIGFRVGEVWALGYVSLACWRQGQYQQGAANHEQIIAICREIGLRSGEALALIGLGGICWRQGRYTQAIDHHKRGIQICHEIGLRSGEALALTSIGLVHYHQRRYRQAAEHHSQAIAISREIDYRTGEANALSNLGLVHCRQGQYQQAVEHHQQALRLFREIGYPSGDALVLSNLGLVHCHQGQYQQAVDDHQQALRLCREAGDRGNEALILNGLGEAYQANREFDLAYTQHAAALTLTTESGDRYEQARAHHGLARTHHATGDLDRARHHWHQVLGIYTDICVPDDNIRTHLTALDQTS